MNLNPAPNPLRAEIIEKAINIEWLINALISLHYLKRVSHPFLMEVLYDEYCSFALKRRVLLKIFPELSESPFSQQIGRVNTIRNYFAHCGQLIGDVKTGVEGVPDPKNPKKNLDFQSLHTEFLALEKPVLEVLFDRYKQLGGTFLDGKPA